MIALCRRLQRLPAACLPLLVGPPFRILRPPLSGTYERHWLLLFFLLLLLLSFSSHYSDPCSQLLKGSCRRPCKGYRPSLCLVVASARWTTSAESYSQSHPVIVATPSSWSEEERRNPKALPLCRHLWSNIAASVPSLAGFSRPGAWEQPSGAGSQGAVPSNSTQCKAAARWRQSEESSEKRALVKSPGCSRSGLVLRSGGRRCSPVASGNVPGRARVICAGASSHNKALEPPCRGPPSRPLVCPSRAPVGAVPVLWLLAGCCFRSIRTHSQSCGLNSRVEERRRAEPVSFVVPRSRSHGALRAPACRLHRAASLCLEGVDVQSKTARSHFALGTANHHSPGRMDHCVGWFKEKTERLDGTESRSGVVGTHSCLFALSTSPLEPSGDEERVEEETQEKAAQQPFYPSPHFNHATWERRIYSWWENRLQLFDPDIAARHVASEDTLFLGRRHSSADGRSGETVRSQLFSSEEKTSSRIAPEESRAQGTVHSSHEEEETFIGVGGEERTDCRRDQLSPYRDNFSGLRFLGNRQDKERLFSSQPQEKAPSFRLLMPPPNVTGALHLGHAASLSLQDLVVRFRRMLMVARGQGFHSLERKTAKLSRDQNDHLGVGTREMVSAGAVACAEQEEPHGAKAELGHEKVGGHGHRETGQSREAESAPAAPLLSSGAEVGSQRVQYGSRRLGRRHTQGQEGEEQPSGTDDLLRACRTEWIPGFDHAGLGMVWLFQKHAIHVQERRKRRTQVSGQQQLLPHSSLSKERNGSGQIPTNKAGLLGPRLASLRCVSESSCRAGREMRPSSEGMKKGSDVQEVEEASGAAGSGEQRRRASVVQRWVSFCQRVIAAQQRRLGCSCNWPRSVFTLDKEYRYLVEHAFVQLYRRGFIRRGSYLTLWDTSARTALADFEVAYPPPESLRFVAGGHSGTTKTRQTEEAVPIVWKEIFLPRIHRGHAGAGTQNLRDAAEDQLGTANRAEKPTSAGPLLDVETPRSLVGKEQPRLYFLSCELVPRSATSSRPRAPHLGQSCCPQPKEAIKEAEGEYEEGALFPKRPACRPEGPAKHKTGESALLPLEEAKPSQGILEENCKELRSEGEPRDDEVGTHRESLPGEEYEGGRKEKLRIAFALNDLRELFGIAAICMKPRAFDRLASSSPCLSTSSRAAAPRSPGPPLPSFDMSSFSGSHRPAPVSPQSSLEGPWFVRLPLVNRLVPLAVHEGEHLHPLAAAAAVQLRRLQQVHASTKNGPASCLVPSAASPSPISLPFNGAQLDESAGSVSPASPGRETSDTTRETPRARVSDVVAVGFPAFQEEGEEDSWFSSSKEFWEYQTELGKQGLCPETRSKLGGSERLLGLSVAKASAFSWGGDRARTPEDSSLPAKSTGRGTLVNAWLWNRVEEDGAALGCVEIGGNDGSDVHFSSTEHCGGRGDAAKEQRDDQEEGTQLSSGRGREEGRAVSGASEKERKAAASAWPRWISHRTGAEVQVRVSRQWLLDLPALALRAWEASVGETSTSAPLVNGRDEAHLADVSEHQQPPTEGGPEGRSGTQSPASIESGDFKEAEEGGAHLRDRGLHLRGRRDTETWEQRRVPSAKEQDCREHRHPGRDGRESPPGPSSGGPRSPVLDGLRLLPDRYERQWVKALRASSLRPWCVSRQLWWGQKLPVWNVKVAGGMQFLRDFTRKLLTKEVATYSTAAQEQRGPALLFPRVKSLGREVAAPSEGVLPADQARESFVAGNKAHEYTGRDYDGNDDVLATDALSLHGRPPVTQVPALKLGLSNPEDFSSKGEGGREQDEEWVEVALTEEEALKAAEERLLQAWRRMGIVDPESALGNLLRDSRAVQDREAGDWKEKNLLSKKSSSEQRREERRAGVNSGRQERDGSDGGRERKDHEEPARGGEGESRPLGEVGEGEEPAEFSGRAAERGLLKVERTKEVLDTWFSSALWAIACAARAGPPSYLLSGEENVHGRATQGGETERAEGIGERREKDQGQKRVEPTINPSDTGGGSTRKTASAVEQSERRRKVDPPSKHPTNHAGTKLLSGSMTKCHGRSVRGAEPLPYFRTPASPSSSLSSTSSSSAFPLLPVAPASCGASPLLPSRHALSASSSTCSASPPRCPLSGGRGFTAYSEAETELVTGEDILFFWVLRQTLLSVELTNRLPFSRVVLHGLLVDSKGQKLSKTKGNAELGRLTQLIDQYGADALRWGLLSPMTPGNPLVFDEANVVKARRFVHKLWNIGRYIARFCKAFPNALRTALEEKWGRREGRTEETLQSERLVVAGENRDFDPPGRREGENLSGRVPSKNEPLIVRYILGRMNEVAYAVTRLILDKSDVGGAARLLQAFLWHDVADWLLPAATAVRERARPSWQFAAQGFLKHALSAPGEQEVEGDRETQTGAEEDLWATQKHARGQPGKDHLSAIEGARRRHYSLWGASPPTMEEEASGDERGNISAVSFRTEESSDCAHHWAKLLLRVFDFSLRLLHPFLPFVSEALFQLVVLPWIRRPHAKRLGSSSAHSAAFSTLKESLDKDERIGIPIEDGDDGVELRWRRGMEMQGDKYGETAHVKDPEFRGGPGEDERSEREGGGLTAGREGAGELGESLTMQHDKAEARISPKASSNTEVPTNEREKTNKQRSLSPSSGDREQTTMDVLFEDQSGPPRALMGSRWPLHATEVPDVDASVTKEFKALQDVVRRVRGAVKKFAQNAPPKDRRLRQDASDVFENKSVPRQGLVKEEGKTEGSERKGEGGNSLRQPDQNGCLYVVLQTSNSKLFRLLQEEKFFLTSLAGLEPHGLRLDFSSRRQHSSGRGTDSSVERGEILAESKVPVGREEERTEKEKKEVETEVTEADDEEKAEDESLLDLQILVSPSLNGDGFPRPTEEEKMLEEKAEVESFAGSAKGRNQVAGSSDGADEWAREREDAKLDAKGDAVKKEDGERRAKFLQGSIRQIRKAEKVKEKKESLEARLKAPLFTARAPPDVQAKLKSRLRRLTREYEELMSGEDS